MADIYKWGRNESVIWPPHGPVYSWSAVFACAFLTTAFMYVCFLFALSPLQQYYLPYYLRSEMAGAIRPAGKYQLLYVLDSSGNFRPVLPDDVKQGKTQQTSAPGIWAAGDVSDALYDQNNISVGDSVKAVLNIYDQLKRG